MHELENNGVWPAPHCREQVSTLENAPVSIDVNLEHIATAFSADSFSLCVRHDGETFITEVHGQFISEVVVFGWKNMGTSLDDGHPRADPGEHLR